MPRPEKVAAVEEVSRALDQHAATLVTHFSGLTVQDMAELRARLREANAEMRVVKNTLTRRAAERAGVAELAEHLTGPTSLVFCAEDPVGPAKTLKAFAKDHPGLVIRAGYLDGQVLGQDEATALAELASREELLARLAGLLHGALANTARLLKASIEQQARLFQALVDAGGANGSQDAAEQGAPATDDPEEADSEEPAPEIQAAPAD